MRKVTVWERWRYAFDNFMAKGTVSLIGGLALVSGLFILVMAGLVTVIGLSPADSPWDFPEALWETLMRTLDTGTVGGDKGWFFRLVMLFVTFGGIFVISTLIGLLGSGIEGKLQELRKGRSRVIETNHVVILGWSLQIFTLLSELILANANVADSCIVILSDMDKVEMDDTLKERLGKTKQTRIVCRTGNTSDIDDLAMVGVQAARSIIVLNPETASSDIQLIKTLLAIVNLPREASQPYHIVAQVHSPKTLEVVNLIGGNQVETLLTSDLISRIMVQTCRQSGLSAVYMELLDFEGNEIYFQKEPKLQGKTYGEILLAYGNAAVMGIKESDGAVYLNPESTMVLPPGAEIILIAEDDHTAQVVENTAQEVNQGAIVTPQLLAPVAEKTLILGWNNHVPQTIYQLDAYVAANSLVTVVADSPHGAEIITAHSQNLVNQQVTFRQGDPTDRETLEQLEIQQYDHIIVLCNAGLEPEEADAQTLVTLVQLRNIADQSRSNSPGERLHQRPIVAEILDVRNQALAQVARPDDFVISEQIISRLLAQVAEQKSLNQVFNYLFSPEQSEVYLKPIANYVRIGEPVNFYTLAAAARSQGESAIGYRLQVNAGNATKNYGVVINPAKADVVTFRESDRLIVVANS
jgi:Trk K+ transport system NAD-binding subunit